MKWYTVFKQSDASMLTPGEYCTKADYEAQLDVAVKCCAESANRIERIWKLEAILRDVAKREFDAMDGNDELWKRIHSALETKGEPAIGGNMISGGCYEPNRKGDAGE